MLNDIFKQVEPSEPHLFQLPLTLGAQGLIVIIGDEGEAQGAAVLESQLLQ